MKSTASVQRYIRRNLHKRSFDVFVACLPGLEHDTFSELQHLLPRLEPRIDKGGLSVQASLSDIYRMNLGLTTANRVLLRLATFSASSFPALFNHTIRTFWPAFVSHPDRVKVQAQSRKSKLNMKQRIETTVLAAIAESFENVQGATRGGEATIYVRIYRDFVTLSLDTTGEHLHKRGNKQLSDVAPLRATLASAAIRRVLDSTHEVVCDPFCGSGTILVEAARHSRGIAPGKHRSFAFMQHPYFRDGTWRQVQRDDKEFRRPHSGTMLIGGDIKGSAVEATIGNLDSVNNSALQKSDVHVNDFRETLLHAYAMSPRGVIITNPPYGVRLGSEGTSKALQRRFVAELAAMDKDWAFAVFTPFPELYSASMFEIQQVTDLRVGGLSVHLLHGQLRKVGINAQ